ncbi:MAG: hypothetical protein M3R35_05835 [Candidatus Eremiobacteraeota bacterium]|nr:hypothetical protein [Candidatus Eremiobacteraeota bacterium]
MDSRVARQAGSQFEGLLLERVLAPMQKAFGPAGDIVVTALAQSVASHDEGGFGALVADALERHHD